MRLLRSSSLPVHILYLYMVKTNHSEGVCNIAVCSISIPIAIAKATCFDNWFPDEHTSYNNLLVVIVFQYFLSL